MDAWIVLNSIYLIRCKFEYLIYNTLNLLLFKLKIYQKMTMPSLFRRREILLPTLLGFVIIILFTVAITLIILKNMATFLAHNEPVQGQYLIVEGWLSEPALLEALTTYKTGGYKFLITTGGPDTRHINPLHETYAEQSAAFIQNRGFDDSNLIVIATPASAQNRTFLSAVMVRDWLTANSTVKSTIDVFSGDVHARRTHKLYKMAFADEIKIGIIAAQANGFDLQYWWQTSEGAKAVLTESAGLLWVTCCFNPGKRGSHQEKWGIY